MSLRQLGRWFDKNVLQNPVSNLFAPTAIFTLGYQMYSKTGLFAKPKMPGIPGAPPTPPDLTDQAIRDAERSQYRNSLFGSRRASFLTGPLGDRSQIPLLQKSILGE